MLCVCSSNLNFPLRINQYFRIEKVMLNVIIIECNCTCNKFLALKWSHEYNIVSFVKVYQRIT